MLSSRDRAVLGRFCAADARGQRLHDGIVSGASEHHQADAIVGFLGRRVGHTMHVGQKLVIGPSLNQVTCIDCESARRGRAVRPRAIRHLNLQAALWRLDPVLCCLWASHIMILPQQRKTCVVRVLSISQLPRRSLTGGVVGQAHRHLVLALLLLCKELIEVAHGQLQRGCSQRHDRQQQLPQLLPVAQHRLPVAFDIRDNIVLSSEEYHGFNAVRRSSFLRSQHLCPWKAGRRSAHSLTADSFEAAGCSVLLASVAAHLFVQR
mmetsp:Transcript_32808/g.78483  ORF Transcript_32808/g.78483 Transcript_32808/m.78483 type:complete len:264 (-) Transcript_32808:274-1065(-)